MYISMKINLHTLEIFDFVGDDSFVDSIDKAEISEQLGLFINEKNLLGNYKGGIQLSINEVDYRGVYHVENDFCSVILINQLLEFESYSIDQIDSLTGLEGKFKLINDIEDLMKDDKKFQLFLFDVDNFSNVTDAYGSKVGDQLIKEIVERILFSVLSNYTLYRYDGDSFALLREGKNDEKFISNLLKLFENIFALDDIKVYLTISIGYVDVTISDGITSESLIDKSYVALNHAKTVGKNTCIMYEDKLKDQSLMELELEMMIKEALKNDEFELYYQPQISLSTNRLIGAEALIRWNHPEKGFISPGVFIPFSEKTGLVVGIGEWVVKEVCRQLRKWLDEGINPVRIGVNIGSLHFKKPSFVDDVMYNLEKYNIDTSLFGLEITEGSVISDIDDLINKLGLLREKGVKVSIDDFGTGYSSLSYLHKLPIDTLKIDQSFILNIPEEHDNIAIVKAIINLAKNMKIKVIAEGVETISARDLLRKLGCHDMQGYLFSKPVNSGDFEMILGDDDILGNSSSFE